MRGAAVTARELLEMHVGARRLGRRMERSSGELQAVLPRADGTVETVTFVISSGVPEIDAAVRRVVESVAPYPPFPPALAREFDVVEIRRTWTFDTAVRLQ